MRVTAVIPDVNPQEWLVTALNFVAREPGIELTILIVPYAEKRERASLLFLAYQAVCNLRSRVAADRTAPWPSHLESLQNKCRSLIEAVTFIQSNQSQIVLDPGSNFIHESAFLDRVACPVWSYSHREDHFRTFLATFRRNDWAWAELRSYQKDGCVVLHREAFRVCKDSFSNTLNKIKYGSTHWIAMNLGLEPKPQCFSPRPPKQENEPPFRTILCYLAQSLSTKILNKFSRSRTWTEHWAIGVSNRNIGRIIEDGFGEVLWLHPPPGYFAADPFIININGKYYIFFELFQHERGFGEIAFIETTDFRSFTPVEIIMSSPRQHLSYPYIIESDGLIYCVPERCDTKRVTLYRAHRFPREWREEKLLLDNFPGVDPTIFFHENQWWMILTDNTSSFDKLYVFLAPSPNGPWIPHGSNPVTSSYIRCARPAGQILKVTDKIYRPAQMGHRYYGYGIILHEIVRLTATEYYEHPVKIITPEVDWPYPDGLHQISSLDDWTIFDAKIHSFDFGVTASRSPGIQLRLAGA